MYETMDRIVDQIHWTEPLAEFLQSRIQAIRGATAPRSVRLRTVLSGSWLGHPLHPAVTDVAVGALATATVLDVVSAFDEDRGIATAADIATITGLTAAVASAVTGINDWADTYGKERKVGLIHGLIMAATTGVYGASTAARLSGHRATGAFSSALGLGLMMAGTYLGGEEVFDLGYGVNHTAFQSGPAEFIAIAAAASVEGSRPVRVDAAGVGVMLVRVDGRVYALADTCVHAGCSLSKGTVANGSITCPCHGSRYQLSDGAVLDGPAIRPEPVFAVRERNGMIEVRAK